MHITVGLEDGTLVTREFINAVFFYILLLSIFWFRTALYSVDPRTWGPELACTKRVRTAIFSVLATSDYTDSTNPTYSVH